MNKRLHRRCPKIERETGERVDKQLRALIPSIKRQMLATDDNCTIVCFGATGSGKSTLGFHAGNIYNEGRGLSPELIGFDPKSWSDALSIAKFQPGIFLMHDEGNFSKRDSMAQRNKDFIDLLFTLRAKNWCLWINNPSADYLDKQLVLDDLVNFFVFIYAKQSRYMFFTRKQMKQLFNKYGDLKADTIKDYGRHYASYDGWFLSYRGDDYDKYLEKKHQRMDNKIDFYIDKYGKGETYTLQMAAKSIGVSHVTLKKYLDLHIDDAGMVDAKKIAGIWRLTPENVDYLRGVIG